MWRCLLSIVAIIILINSTVTACAFNPSTLEEMILKSDYIVAARVVKHEKDNFSYYDPKTGLTTVFRMPHVGHFTLQVVKSFSASAPPSNFMLCDEDLRWGSMVANLPEDSGALVIMFVKDIPNGFTLYNANGIIENITENDLVGFGLIVSQLLAIEKQPESVEKQINLYNWYLECTKYKATKTEGFFAISRVLELPDCGNRRKHYTVHPQLSYWLQQTGATATLKQAAAHYNESNWHKAYMQCMVKQIGG